MKKLFFILSLCLLAAPLSRAQILKMGLRGGVNSGIYSFDTFVVDGKVITPVSDFDAGYQLGLVLRLSIPHFVYIQPELNFLSRDYTFGVAASGRLPNYKTVRTERLELPVAIGVKLAALRLFGGPVFRLGAHQCALGDDNDLSVAFDDKEVAAMAGFAIDLRNVFVEARCMKYLNKTSSVFSLGHETATINPTTDEFWQFSIGFLF